MSEHISLYFEKKIDADSLESTLRLSMILGGSKLALVTYYLKKADHVLWEELGPFLIDGKEELEPVTTYPEEEIDYRFDCYSLGDDTIGILKRHYAGLADFLDSVAVYPEEGKEWLSCSIFHEGMTILRVSPEQRETIDNLGLAYSLEPPSWW